MVKKKIDKIGIELEGGWDKTFADAVIIADHSVHTPLTSSLTGKAAKHYGEIPSPPFLDLESLRSWLLKHYPTAVNNHCGFHVHISLRKNLYYSQLMDRAFFKFFRTQADKWGKEEGIPAGDPFWTRLSGQNKFCTTTFIPHKQAQIVVKEQNDARRYTMLNYCHGMHGTIEYRLAPQFPSGERAFSWVEFIVNTAEEWLSQQPPEKVMSFKLRAKELDIMSQVRKDFDSLKKKAA